MTESRANRLPWQLLYALLGIIWGSSFLFTKLGLEVFDPIGLVFWRLVSGSLALGIIVFSLRRKLPRSLKTWALVGSGGLFMNTLPFLLYSFAQENATSVLASIINGATPIATLLALLTIFRSEKVRAEVITGLLIGLAGILVVFAVWNGFGATNPLAVLAMVGAITCYGIGGPYIRRFVSPLGLQNDVAAFLQITVSALGVLPFYVIHPQPIAPLNVISVASVATLGAVGTGLAYIMYYRVIAVAGSAIANSVTYLTPVVAIIWGVLLLGEPVYWYEPVGGLIVVLGALISQGRIKLPFSTARPDESVA
jgi:drug/metabolite transporter (DMT)-like permease